MLLIGLPLLMSKQAIWECVSELEAGFGMLPGVSR